MRRLPRILLALLIAVIIYFPLQYLLQRVEWYAQRELYLVAEKVGFTQPNPVGAMQILGQYLQGPPQWVRYTVQTLAVLLAVCPILWLSTMLFHLVAHGWFRSDQLTRCGSCGGVLAKLEQPVCPHCDTSI